MRLKAIFIVVFATSSAVLAAPNVKLPNYQFKYTVNDPNTNDHKIQVERKVGDQLTTAYVVKTIHPVPPNGVQSGNSYIGVTRWSGDKVAPLDLSGPIALHPFINKFGIGHKVGLYPPVNKNPVKPPPVYKVPKDRPHVIYNVPSHEYDGPKEKPQIIYKVPSAEYTWPKDKPYNGDKIPSIEYSWSKDKIPTVEYTWSKERPYTPSIEYAWPKDKPYSSDKYPSSSYEWSNDKSYQGSPKPKPIFIIIEKRPASKAYHTVSKSYKGGKVPNYEVSYDWPKRYGHNKYDHDDDTLLYNVDENGKKYEINYPLKDYGTHAESKDYDDQGNNKGLYHRYTYDMRYGSGSPKIPFDSDDDKKYDVDSRKVDDDDEDDEEDDEDDDEYVAPKIVEKISSKKYESSHSYGDKDEKGGWDDGDVEKSKDDDHDEEDEDYFRKSEYKSPSYVKDDGKFDFKGSKWFHDKRDGDEEGYKSYEQKNEKDCEETSH